MKNSTRIRLHLSKTLFESLAEQILAEAKDMSGGVYTEVVKGKKDKKKVEEKKDKVEEMETKVAEKVEEKKVEEKKGHTLDELKKAKEKLEKKINELESSEEEE